MTDISFDKRAGKLSKFGMGVSSVFFGLLVASAFLVKIEGSVISPSEVVSTGNNKAVQHLDGGTIKEIMVKNGDTVFAGTPILVLDGTAIEAEFNVTKFREVELKAKIARLRATLEGKTDFAYYRLRSALAEDPSHERIINQAIETQTAIFYASLDNHAADLMSLQSRLSFFNDEVSALDLQVETTRKSIGLIRSQLNEVAPLIAEKLVARSRQWALEREMIATQEKLDSLNVQRVKTQSALRETENSLEKLEVDQNETLLDQLEAAQTELQSVSQAKKNLSQKLSRLVVTAPVSGTVLNLKFYNAQGVIRAGDVILEIVPENAGHELRARIQPIDIDQVSFGQEVRLRFEAFDANTTPEIWGTVKDISADRLIDGNTGVPYYEVAVAMSPEQLRRLGPLQIVPGMPATAMFRTTDRSLFSYLAQPIQQQATRAFH